MPDAPTLDALRTLAARAIDRAEGEAQATVVWERDDHGDRLTVDVTCILDGRAATARAAGTDEQALLRAARAAAVNARRPRAWPSAGLPDPLPGRAHEGFDPTALQPAPPAPPAPGLNVSVQVGVARVAIASTRGVDAAEQRSHAIADVRGGGGGRTVRLRRAATGPGALDLPALVDEARALLRGGAEAVDAPEGSFPVVLGHDAVATVLDHLRAAFGVELDIGSGPLHGRFGTRVASAAVNLSDSPRYHGTLPRSFDAEGMPRSPVPLIQDGVAHRRVHDTASAARSAATSTGHASRAAALAPVPDHLVLVGGGAATVEELCAPAERGLYVPALSSAREADGDAYLHTSAGAILIEAGELTAPVRDTQLRIDPLAVLGSVGALSARSRAIPLNGHAPGGPGAAVVPCVRAMDGCSVANDRK